MLKKTVLCLAMASALFLGGMQLVSAETSTLGPCAFECEDTYQWCVNVLHRPAGECYFQYRACLSGCN